MLSPLEKPSVQVDDPDAFVSFVAAGFRAPRKQIHNSLRLGLQTPTHAVAGALFTASIEGSRRPATLSLDEWGDLYEAWMSQPDAEDQEC